MLAMLFAALSLSSCSKKTQINPEITWKGSATTLAEQYKAGKMLLPKENQALNLVAVTGTLHGIFKDSMNLVPKLVFHTGTQILVKGRLHHNADWHRSMLLEPGAEVQVVAYAEIRGDTILLRDCAIVESPKVPDWFFQPGIRERGPDEARWFNSLPMRFEISYSFADGTKSVAPQGMISISIENPNDFWLKMKMKTTNDLPVHIFITSNVRAPELGHKLGRGDETFAPDSPQLPGFTWTAVKTMNKGANVRAGTYLIWFVNPNDEKAEFDISVRAREPNPGFDFISLEK
jgi:hypothetical protein